MEDEQDDEEETKSLQCADEVPSGVGSRRWGQTINQVASEQGLHPNQVSQWKRQLLEDGPAMLGGGTVRQQREPEAREAELYEQIGRLKMELEWLKKKLPDSVEEKRVMIEFCHPEISMRRQCEWMGLNRATLYDQPATESQFNLHLMRLIDEPYRRTPFYGWPRMTAWVQRQGYEINHKRVQRLMQKMGLQAIYPQPRTSVTTNQHTIYPSLLREVKIVRPNQVWSADMTYIRLVRGFMDVVAILDWFSRYVVSWELSNSLDVHFCRAALDRALAQGEPEIFNSDQGAQFTSHAFTSRLEEEGVRLSMDGRGRVFDNIFVERLWRTVQYEDIYIKDYGTVPALERGLTTYFSFYNHERLHQSLDYRTPAEVHFGHEKRR